MDLLSLGRQSLFHAQAWAVCRASRGLVCAGSRCWCLRNVWKLLRGCCIPQVFGKGHVLPRHLWGRLVQAVSCPAMAYGRAREDGTCRLPVLCGPCPS